MSNPRLVVGALVVDDIENPSRVLVGRRFRPQHYAGLWEFPGGKAEGVERPEGALSRELIEELDLHVRVSREFPSSLGSWPIDDPTYELRLFLCTTHGQAQPGDTHDEVRWVGAEELRSLPLLPGDVAPALQLADLMIDRATRPRSTGSLQAGELTLRPVRLSDSERVAEPFADPDVVRWLGHGTFTLPQTRLVVAESVEKHARGEKLTFVVERESEVIGRVTLGLRPMRSHLGLTGEWEGDLGYVIFPSHQGRGYATQASRALFEHGFRDLGLRRISAMVFADADASHQVCSKLGMREEGRFLKSVLGADGEWLDDVAYALLREEWESQQV